MACNNRNDTAKYVPSDTNGSQGIPQSRPDSGLVEPKAMPREEGSVGAKRLAQLLIARLSTLGPSLD